MKILKNIAVRLTALLVFFALIVAVILYQAGVYDISFIKRPLPAVTEESDSVTGSETDIGTEAPFPDTSDTDIPDTETSISTDNAEKMLEMILSLSEVGADGWRLSENMFGSKSSIARLAFDFGEIKNNFGSRTETVTKTIIYQKEDGLYDTKQVTEKKTAPSVRLYYGLIFLDDGKTVSVWNTDGKRLIKKFTGSLVYAKSLSGRPVVSIKTKYYEIDSEKGLTGEISENQIDFRAIRFDAPGYYAADRGNGPYPYCEYVEVYTEITTEPPVTEPEATSPESTDTEEPDTTSSDDTDSEAETTSPEETESNEEPVSSEDADTDEETDSNPNPVISLSEKRNEASEGEETVVIDGKLYSVETVLMWGYRDGEGNTVIEPQFEAAFDFTSDGIAAVVDFEKRMSFIDRTGKTVITLNDKEIIRYSDQQRTKVRQSYFEPVSNGMENLGMYYFDRGYAMVRYVYRGTKTEKIYLNENRLLSKTGEYFDIPAGYNLINYSDGVLLLEKNGKYGYMDLDGGWIMPSVYSFASPYVQGLAAVAGSDGKYCLIDTDGNYVLPMYFDYVSNVSGGLVCTYEQTRGWEIYCVVEK